MQHIRSVIEASLSLLKSNPPQLLISAVGTVSSGGWKNPSLDRRHYIAPPSDGILDYDFSASPPVGTAIQVILPIAAQDVLVEIPLWLKGVRIHSATNQVEAYTFTSKTLDLI